MYVLTIFCPCIALTFTPTLGGGDVKAYFVIVETNFAHNIGLLDVLVLLYYYRTELLTHNKLLLKGELLPRGTKRKPVVRR